ncbi:T9SS type A sorting domain-containing protein [Pontibacter sp. G13]|uniref:T9SS type A sorting domain-containing protein n=1 Tax=Pontibacter sp. G13 TaxID=3074898 RepID=UPI002889205A|nr:T9SS type A sorting domain-containing protein [Pontibacter sp. G13]WNJ18643.1 T9SS type A sorting domain-containing protein [Pontibacter sp. G13]
MIRFFTGLLFFLSAHLTLNAQITLDMTHMPTPGYAPWVSIADTLMIGDPGLTGEGITWDYSSLSPISQRRDSFISPSQAPFSYQILFFGADVVRVQSAPDSIGGFAIQEVYEFFDTQMGAFHNMGYGATINGLPVTLANNPTDSVLTLPLLYTRVDSSVASATLNAFGIYVQQNSKRWNHCDGWGTLITPYGTFNVLHMVTDIVGDDTISINGSGFSIQRPKTRQYKWLAQEEGLPVLQINAIVNDSLGTEVITSVEYIDIFRNLGPLANHRVQQPLGMYPNPTQGALNLDLGHTFDQQAELSIFDLQGRKVWQQAISPQAPRLNVGHLPAGVYQIEIALDGDIRSGKLVIE